MMFSLLCILEMAGLKEEDEDLPGDPPIAADSSTPFSESNYRRLYVACFYIATFLLRLSCTRKLAYNN